MTTVQELFLMKRTHIFPEASQDCSRERVELEERSQDISVNAVRAPNPIRQGMSG